MLEEPNCVITATYHRYYIRTVEDLLCLSPIILSPLNGQVKIHPMTGRLLIESEELQRVAVISACNQGEMACARAAELLCLSVAPISA